MFRREPGLVPDLLRGKASQFGTVFWRYCTLSYRNPATLVVSAVQPVIYLFLFGPVLTGISNLSVGSPSAYSVYVPGLMMQQALFGGAFAGLTLMTEFRLGVLERIFATPLSRGVLLGGRVLRDSCLVVAQGAILLLLSLLLGARYSFLAAIACLGLAFLVGTALSALSYFAALLTHNEGTISNVFNVILLPVLLLSGAMLPITLGPRWIFWISRMDPLSYIVDGARGTFHNSFAIQLALAYGVALTVAVVSFSMGLWAMRRS